jgi:hypothetical protein
MSGPDKDFLSRWSRRKLDPAREPEPDAGGEGSPPQPGTQPAGQATAPAQQEKKEEPPFDVSSLPSIESIGADTDISAFLRAGVPENLKLAAMRRVWVTDPAIRDFKGLQEYDWDFNAPGVAGFGPIGPDVDVQAMARRIMGDSPAPEPTVEQDAAVPAQKVEQVPVTANPLAELRHDGGSDVAGSNNAQTANAAPQNIEPGSGEKLPAIKRHGSALPS